MSTKKPISRVYSVLFVLAFLLAQTFSALGVTPTQAAGIRYAKPAASGTGDCSSWANACTLQTALTGAVSGNEIWAAAGTHKPITGADRTATFQLKSGVALYGGFAGTETARDQRNPALNVTILSGDIDNNDSQTPIITNLTTVTGNTTNSYHVVTGATSATLDGFTITAGNANGTFSNDSGGGMYNSSSSPTLTNVTFSGNTASSLGSGMDNLSSSPTLTNVTFSGNAASSGGGMYNSSSSPTLTNVTFSGNTASSFGGGMENLSSSPTLTNVTFSGNAASFGGGMFNGSSSPTLTNITFSGNTASSFGGGMENFYSDSSPTIRNTIFWGNTAGAQIDNAYGSTPSVSYSVVQGGYAGGTHIITADPMLGALGNYGGSTQTIPLLAGSSAIDAGDNATCAATDQRGYVRPVDGDGNGSAICDIGAYEAGSVPPSYLYLPLVQKSGPQITPTPTATPGFATPTPTPTRTATPTTPAPIVPTDGIYKFSSGVPYMDRNASLFRVSGSSITSLLVYISTSTCNFGYIFTSPPGLPIPIIGGSFSYSQGTDFIISGSFTNATTATGTIYIYWRHDISCNFDYNYSGPWQASWWGP